MDAKEHKTPQFLAMNPFGQVPVVDRLVDDQDWRYYYVNFFVDRDMYMRYLGGGVGHYQVPIPLEEDPAPAEEEEEDEEGPEWQDIEEVHQPPVTPPGTPPNDEPASPVSDSDSESHDSNESEDSPKLPDGEYDEEEPDLGVEDGEGEMEDEVEEGYAPL
ncbi:hypothetical protein K438DRAFT_1940544 [Mycena galopus ATCC 62051]|nr:hypothetical protein K438DRAFT_1940544 [Mycena galopus ATCC 62051]